MGQLSIPGVTVGEVTSMNGMGIQNSNVQTDGIIGMGKVQKVVRGDFTLTFPHNIHLMSSPL